MARRKKNGEGEQTSPGPTHNLEALNDEQRQALHFQHVRLYEQRLAAKKKADADLRNAGKLIKAEGDSVDRVKQTLLARTPEGEAELRAEVEQVMEVLRWSGVETGDTKDMFPEDRTPSIERAYAEGKRVGLDGQPAKPPHDPGTEQYREWMRGHGDGQTVLAAGFKPLSSSAETEGDDKPSGEPRQAPGNAFAANVAAGDAHIKAVNEKLGTAPATHVAQ